MPHPLLAGRAPTAANAFAADQALFERFVAGQLACMRELTLLYAPHVNSYKRFAAGSFAPTAIAWGKDNRTCSLRVVGHGEGLRVENRLPGADVNPYLALSAMIAAGLHGIDNELELEPAFEGNAYESDKPRVPAQHLRRARPLRGQRGRARGVRRRGRRPLPEPGARSRSTPSRRRSPTGSATGASSGFESRAEPGAACSRHLRRDRARAPGASGTATRSTLAPRNYVARGAARRRRCAIAAPARRGRGARPRRRCSTGSTALLLAGGADIDPASYGAEPHPETTRHLARARRLRARADPAGARARHAGARHLPRHAAAQRRAGRDARPAPAGVDRRRGATARSPGTFGDHEVRLAPGSLAVRRGRRRRAAWSCPTTTRGSSGSARACAVSGWSADDDVVEAIELPDRRFALGVLWHPEEDEDEPADRGAGRGGARARWRHEQT